MKKYITALGLALALGIGASVAAEPVVTLESLRSKLTPLQRESVDAAAIMTECYSNPAFYQQIKAAGWIFEGVKLQDYQVASVAARVSDWDAISPTQAAQWLPIPSYKSWVAGTLAQKGETLAAYDWLQAQRLVALGAAVATSGEKVEFLDALAAQILASAKARGN